MCVFSSIFFLLFSLFLLLLKKKIFFRSFSSLYLTHIRLGKQQHNSYSHTQPHLTLQFSSTFFCCCFQLYQINVTHIRSICVDIPYKYKLNDTQKYIIINRHRNNHHQKNVQYFVVHVFSLQFLFDIYMWYESFLYCNIVNDEIIRLDSNFEMHRKWQLKRLETAFSL